jgi:hypothetical protein
MSAVQACNAPAGLISENSCCEGGYPKVYVMTNVAALAGCRAFTYLSSRYIAG